MARWILIVGPKRSEKVRYAQGLADRLTRSGVAVGGFLQVKPRDGRCGWKYELMRMTTGERIPLARENTRLGTKDESFCSLDFDMESFTRSREWIEEDAAGAQVLFIGDVSKLEVTGRGHHDTLAWALAQDALEAVVICARSDQLFYIFDKFGLEDDGLAWLELPVDRDETEAFYQRAVGSLSPEKSLAQQQ